MAGRHGGRAGGRAGGGGGGGAWWAGRSWVLTAISETILSEAPPPCIVGKCDVDVVSAVGMVIVRASRQANQKCFTSFVRHRAHFPQTRPTEGWSLRFHTRVAPGVRAGTPGRPSFITRQSARARSAEMRIRSNSVLKYTMAPSDSASAATRVGGWEVGGLSKGTAKPCLAHLCTWPVPPPRPSGAWQTVL